MNAMANRKQNTKRKKPTPLAKYLKSWRQKKGLTQKEVADKIEMSRSFICRVERGNRQRKPLQGYILYQLAQAYGAPVGKVLKKANWPQLLLIGADDKEKEELIQYLKEHL